MNLFFETQMAITSLEGRIDALQVKPIVDEQPVLTQDRYSDATRATAKTVLKDGGIYRMWYQAVPDPAAPQDPNFTAYAESDNGIDWRKPDLSLVPGLDFPNNYTNLGLCQPSVFIDPEAPPSHRYRGVGYRRGTAFANPKGTTGCEYAAHSADGLNWELDSTTPQWLTGDTIKAAYHPTRKQGIVTTKFVRRVNGIHRRSIWTSEMVGGQWQPLVCALMPDAFDDMAAIARGCTSCDFYSMGMLPASTGTVGLLDCFWHRPPLSMGPDNYAIYGNSDIVLAFQESPTDRWLHMPGRPTFISHGTHPWNAGWMWGTSGPVEHGNEQWFYVTGSKHEHAWHMTPDWKTDEGLKNYLQKYAPEHAVGVARWPRWRLFGLHANPRGVVEFELGELDEPKRLRLNYQTEPAGSIRVQIFARQFRERGEPIAGRTGDDMVPLDGDELCAEVMWKDGSLIQPVPERRIVVRLTLDRATVYAWDLQPEV